MNSWAWASLAASTTSSMEASLLPQRMLSATVPVNKTDSCRQNPIWLRRASRSHSLTSTPSTFTEPLVTSV